MFRLMFVCVCMYMCVYIFKKKPTSLCGGRNIVEALFNESSYSPHSIIGINEQTSPQGPEAL